MSWCAQWRTAQRFCSDKHANECVVGIQNEEHDSTFNYVRVSFFQAYLLCYIQTYFEDASLLWISITWQVILTVHICLTGNLMLRFRCVSWWFPHVLIPSPCAHLTGHGTCSCGHCVCERGWFGVLCQHPRKCNMTEEHSKSLCESADGRLCSGKGEYGGQNLGCTSLLTHGMFSCQQQTCFSDGALGKSKWPSYVCTKLEAWKSAAYSLGAQKMAWTA